ncbi:hypothetical protein BDZ45DRAFT_747102 [Acephala macrosclerotiorum]|nr:hypothetical protein BDZ45DRAFT_747102 [Acephala macrosclerotiorum]
MDPSDEMPEPGTGVNTERNKRKKEPARQKKLEKQEAQKIADELNACVLKQVGKYANSGDSVPPIASVEPLFEIKLIPGKGLGLVARRFTSRGTEILREDAILKSNREIRIFEPNCFGFYTEKDFKAPFNTYIYLISARINHDCMPNTAGAFTDEEYTAVQAIRDIHPGEEITRDYHNLKGTTDNITITDAQAMAKVATRENPRNTTTLLHKATPAEIQKDKEIDLWLGARLVDFAILQRAIEGGVKKNLEDNNDYGLGANIIERHASTLTQAAFDKMMARFAKLKARVILGGQDRVTSGI